MHCVYYNLYAPRIHAFTLYLSFQLSHHHEEKVQTLMEQVATTKEGVIQKEMELKAEHCKKEMAQSNVSEVTRTLKVVRESMSVMDETYRQLEEEKVELMQKIQQLEQQVTS